jgi:hypothetical protein
MFEGLEKFPARMDGRESTVRTTRRSARVAASFSPETPWIGRGYCSSTRILIHPAFHGISGQLDHIAALGSRFAAASL